MTFSLFDSIRSQGVDALCRIPALNDIAIFLKRFKHSEKSWFGNIQHHCMPAELRCAKGIRVCRKKVRSIENVPLNRTEAIKA